MKVYNNLFNKMVSLENLLLAWDGFKKGKRDKLDVQMFEYHMEDNLFELYRDLTAKTYKHEPYSGFFIRDPKLRHIHKATVRDRIVHHLIYQSLNPIFEPTFISDSYSCRKNKGTHKAVKQLEIYARKVFQTHGKCFVLKCDIRKFFEGINHEILIKIIQKRVKDNNVLWLIKEVIKSFDKGILSKGLPIGNLTSQLFANIYMNEFDQFMKHKLKTKLYIRYTDDFVILHHSLVYLKELKTEIEAFLKNELNLSLHDRKVELRKLKQGIDFLGYVQLPKARLLRTKMKHRIFKKMKHKVRLLKQEKIEEKNLTQSFSSYLGVMSHGDCHKLHKKLHHQVWNWIKSYKT